MSITKQDILNLTRDDIANMNKLDVFSMLLNDNIRESMSSYRRRFDEALADDLNTPKAIAIMHELTTEINKTTHPLDRQGLQEALKDMMRTLGFNA